MKLLGPDTTKLFENNRRDDENYRTDIHNEDRAESDKTRGL
jgi:hypothetical protein